MHFPIQQIPHLTSRGQVELMEWQTFRLHSITRARKIVHWTPKRGYVRYSMAEPDAQKEVARIFGWVVLVELHPRTPNALRLKILMDLQANALEIPSRVLSEGNDAVIAMVE